MSGPIQPLFPTLQDSLHPSASMSSSPVPSQRQMTGAQVREAFIRYFESKEGLEHTHWKSSPCVPLEDPTLLFANAGMNQFKAIFVGSVDPRSDMASLKRAANSQKCIRAGGKHNDLEDVGRDTYHHTFFEMLGSWSFGDYFKKEAIDMAWEFLTVTMGLNPDNMYATYFEGNEDVPCDSEARELWLRFLPEEHVIPGNAKDNFWEMGDVGPCGPCSEIHYDRIGGRNAASKVNQDDPNVLEIWNLVFMQYNREEKNGALRRLPAFHVDTGMGLERLASVVQGKYSNYDTDLFMPIFAKIQELTGARPYTGKLGEEDPDKVDTSYRVIADHVRTLTFSIADGCIPSNDFRGYVLRRILRRGARFAMQFMGCKEPGLISSLVPTVVQEFGGYFPELVERQTFVQEVILDEEVAFYRTLQNGIALFQGLVKDLGGKVVPGREAFRLYDTFGFPLDLTDMMAEELGLAVDHAAFDEAMEEAREKSRQGAKTVERDLLGLGVDQTAQLADSGVPVTDDSHKYQWSPLEDCTVLRIWSTEGWVETGKAGDRVAIILDKTNYYAKSGGQTFDTGSVLNQGDHQVIFSVEDVKVQAGYVTLVGEVKGTISVGQKVISSPDFERRAPIASNHTSTHLLNWALRQAVSADCNQEGSEVGPDSLRFDFSNRQALSVDTIREIERLVQDQIDRQLPVNTTLVNLEEALTVETLRKLKGKAYHNPARMVSIGVDADTLIATPSNPEWMNYSVEFCGGTHLPNTSVAKRFRILSETGIANGIRRIVAVTGAVAEEVTAYAASILQEQQQALETGDEDTIRAMQNKVAAILRGGASASSTGNSDASGSSDAVAQSEEENPSSAAGPSTCSAGRLPTLERAEIAEQQKKLLSKLKEFRNERLKRLSEELQESTKVAALQCKEKGEPFLVLSLEFTPDKKVLDSVLNGVCPLLSDEDKGAAMLVCADPDSDKVQVHAQVSSGALSCLKASEWVACALSPLGGRGGGRPNRAQGSGAGPHLIPTALEEASQFARQALSLP